MNMVVCRHPGDSGKYIFRIPDECEIDVGSLVRVQTKRGLQPAQCITGSFKADPNVVCALWGTTPGKMQKVVSVLYESVLNYPGDSMSEQELPFTDIDE